MEKIICGIQQVGIGIPDLDKAWKWYREHFGMDIPVLEEAASADLMIDYTGNEVHSRRATIAINMQGGGGFEIWQFTSRGTNPAEFEIQLGDTGLFVAKMKTRDVQKAYDFFKGKNAKILGELSEDPNNKKHFFVQDPHGFIFQIVEGEDWFSDNGGHIMGGPSGMIIGVSDMDKSLQFYNDILGYDTVVYDKTGVYADFTYLPGGKHEVRRVLIKHKDSRKGPFSDLFGHSQLELVQVMDREPKKIFKDRFWGDLGFIHLCFDVKHMDALKEECEAKGYPFTVDSNNSFDMGEAAGRFSYIEDPDGTLIEFVETHKIPLMKKLGWYLDLRKRKPEKALPKWMLKTMRFGRVKD